MVILALALLAAPGCAGHQLPDQRHDVASVRRVDSAWTVAYLHGDTAFMRCMLTADYRGYSLSGVGVDRDGEVGKAARFGRPDRPLPAYPNASIEVHGASAVVDGISNGRRWIDVYRFEDGVWHAFLSADVKLPEGSPAS
jgi:hypothetical protein